MKILILGGTSEGRELAALLSADRDISVVVSLAGRTHDPADLAGKIITGGFGGVEGLRDYLRAENFNLVVDATHPFAEQISRNALMAANQADVAFLRIQRPAWAAVDGDQWINVQSHQQAIAALGDAPRRVFLVIGRQHVGAYLAAPQHFYLVRSIEPVGEIGRFAHAEQILDRGPFSVENELALMRGHSIDVMVTKNSGGDATAAKLAAARQLHLPVIMISKPVETAQGSVGNAGEAFARIQDIKTKAAY